MTNDHKAGLTLIEVMLATVILAVGLTTLISATTRCLAVARKAKEYETARRLIGQVDLEIPPDFEDLEEDVETGNFSSPFQDYAWRREIVEHETEDFQLFTVKTEVSWSNKGKNSHESVETYIYKPTYVRGGSGGR